MVRAAVARAFLARAHGAECAGVRTSKKLALLGSLYFCQGLPFGFFTQALPVLLRQQGVSLAVIGSTSLLGLPWMVKFLWAPLVDRYGSSRWGTRRAWIVPLQLATISLMMVLSAIDPERSLWGLFAGVLCANFLAATQDIATDALAIDMLDARERGFGNGVQVAGYRVGMIVGGGLLLMVFEELGFTRSFWVMALLLFLASAPILLFREPARPFCAKRDGAPGISGIWRVLTRPSMRAFLPILLMYKSADAFGTAMLRPFLVDRGETLTRIGWVLGTLGFVSGLVGALLGGALAARFARKHVLVGAAGLHALGMALYAACAAELVRDDVLLLSIVFEHLTGGMATAALFTVMMDHAAPASAATDYTVQASLVLFAGGLFAWPSGLLAEAVGYAAHFALAFVLGLGVTAWVFVSDAVVEPQAIRTRGEGPS